jgi:hypothetical protein
MRDLLKAFARSAAGMAEAPEEKPHHQAEAAAISQVDSDRSEIPRHGRRDIGLR